MRDGERKEKESFTILLAEFLCRSRCEEASEWSVNNLKQLDLSILRIQTHAIYDKQIYPDQLLVFHVAVERERERERTGFL